MCKQGLLCISTLQIHRDSSSSLSKLILQSYHGQMDPVSLTGLTPVHMLLEMGLGKMRKDYTYHLMGNAAMPQGRQWQQDRKCIMSEDFDRTLFCLFVCLSKALKS